MSAPAQVRRPTVHGSLFQHPSGSSHGLQTCSCGITIDLAWQYRLLPIVQVYRSGNCGLAVAVLFGVGYLKGMYEMMKQVPLCEAGGIFDDSGWGQTRFGIVVESHKCGCHRGARSDSYLSKESSCLS